MGLSRAKTEAATQLLTPEILLTIQILGAALEIGISEVFGSRRDYRETFTRMSCCSWLRRLWTLQEATLNRDLLFQFSDRAIYTGEGSKLHVDQQLDNKNHPWDLVAWECSWYYNFGLRTVTSYFNHALLTKMLWDAVGIRTTSRRGDEPLCLAILFRLDIEAF
jgi:hypothetical protein